MADAEARRWVAAEAAARASLNCSAGAARAAAQLPRCAHDELGR